MEKIFMERDFIMKQLMHASMRNNISSKKEEKE